MSGIETHLRTVVDNQGIAKLLQYLGLEDWADGYVSQQETLQSQADAITRYVHEKNRVEGELAQMRTAYEETFQQLENAKRDVAAYASSNHSYADTVEKLQAKVTQLEADVHFWKGEYNKKPTEEPEEATV